jgi:transcriptional regulator with XRE-family HTH domain
MNKDFKSTIALKLKDAFARERISLNQLQMRSGVSASRFEAILKEEGYSIDLLIRVADFLNVELLQHPLAEANTFQGDTIRKAMKIVIDILQSCESDLEFIEKITKILNVIGY